jgi:hypothetical protein
MAVASAAVTAGGALYQGKAAQSEANAAAAAAEMSAGNERMAGAVKAERIAEKYSRMRGTQAANAAASGINPAAGSASLIIDQETTKNSYLDQLTTIWNAESAADSLDYQAAGLRQRGKNAKTASYFNAAGSFLSGLGKAKGMPQSSATSIE